MTNATEKIENSVIILLLNTNRHTFSHDNNEYDSYDLMDFFFLLFFYLFVYSKIAYHFQENLLRTMIQIENTYFELGKSCSKNCLIICDRGVMDASACKYSSAPSNLPKCHRTQMFVCNH